MDGSGATVLRCELARLKRPFNENVVALLVQGHDVSEVAVKHQAVPVRVFLRLIVAVGVAVALSNPRVRNGRSRGQIANGWLAAKVARQLNSILLHFLSAP